MQGLSSFYRLFSGKKSRNIAGQNNQWRVRPSSFRPNQRAPKKKEQMPEQNDILEQHINSEVQMGFTTDIDTETFAKGLNEGGGESAEQKKEQAGWLLEFRLKAYRHWLTMKRAR